MAKGSLRSGIWKQTMLRGWHHPRPVKYLETLRRELPEGRTGLGRVQRMDLQGTLSTVDEPENVRQYSSKYMVAREEWRDLEWMDRVD